jgi:AcrR family transcriptional regulator
MTGSLSPEDWIAAAFRALSAGGLQAVRAEALARGLGVSKGSFYWHFKDVPSLLHVMLTHWEDQATDRILDMADAGARDAAGQLWLVADLATSDLADPYGGFHTEAAIRDWARHDPMAGAVVARVDERRLEYLEAAFARAGLDRPGMRARLFLSGLVGAQHLSPADLDTQRAHLRMLMGMLLSRQAGMRPVAAHPSSA